MATDDPQPAATADPLLGRTVLGRYRVEKKLGEGGMGAVYLVRHAKLPNTFAALKVMLGEGASSTSMAERFEQEAMVAAAVGNHRVARPLDIGQFDDGIPYILMEFVPGRSLADALGDRGAFDVATALLVAGRVADTMAIAHQRGIIHRDLKPPNIMLADEGGTDLVVKILDFGVARATGEYKVAHTGERSVIGTAGYMAPEACAALAVDGRADVFSLGVILYEMLSGRPPFASETLQGALLKTLAENPAPIATHRPPEHGPVSESVQAVVFRALAKEPSERYTMVEFQAALATVLRGTSASDVRPDPHRASLRQPTTLPPEKRPTLATPAGEVAELARRLGHTPGASPPMPAGGSASMERDASEVAGPSPLPRNTANEASATRGKPVRSKARWIWALGIPVLLVAGFLVWRLFAGSRPLTASAAGTQSSIQSGTVHLPSAPTEKGKSLGLSENGLHPPPGTVAPAPSPETPGLAAPAVKKTPRPLHHKTDRPGETVSGIKDID